MKNNLNNKRNFLDLEMLERLQKGDSEAFAALFHAHKARIYHICLCMTRHTVQAEDLTRDAFLQVFRKLSTFEGNSPLSTWFFRSAINTILMHLRNEYQKQISQDEPCSHGVAAVHSEHGGADCRQSGAVRRMMLTRAN
jgi:RNA polymerase sigma-70 factor, ECF subfamily